MNLIIKCKFGSHLYGTATPQSYTDYKGVAIPTWEQVCLGKIPKHMQHTSTGEAHCKNTADDVDTEIFSLHEFIKLALEGQTVALDMLHAPLSMVDEYNYLWVYIIKNRHRFYTNRATAFVRYARKQAAKYGMIDEVEELTKISFLPSHPDTKFWNQFLIDVVEEIPKTKYANFVSKFMVEIK